MRVEPELPDHPKFVRLKRRVGDYAMEALIRLWGHCQANQRGEVWHGKDSEYVEVVCEWDGEPGLLFRSLKETGWLDEQNGAVIIHEWNDQNRQFLANWAHGPRGGRPRKPNENQSVSSTNGSDQNGTEKTDCDKTAHPNANQSVNQSETNRVTKGVTDRTKLNLTSSLKSEGGVGETPETSHKPNANQSVNQSETSGEPALRYDLAREVLNFLNERTGAAFPESSGTMHLIASRLAEVSQDLPGIFQMIGRQVACWGQDAEMKNYLRPATLFHEEKFPNYFGQRKLPLPSGERGAGSKERKTELLALIEKSPANKESVYHHPNASAEEKEKLRAWKAELKEKS